MAEYSQGIMSDGPVILRPDGDPMTPEEIVAALNLSENVLRQINIWCDAYPTFVEPTKEQWLKAHNLLNKAGGCSLTAISGSRRKHVIDGIQKIINKERPSKGDE